MKTEVKEKIVREREVVLTLTEDEAKVLRSVMTQCGANDEVAADCFTYHLFCALSAFTGKYESYYTDGHLHTRLK